MMIKNYQNLFAFICCITLFIINSTEAQNFKNANEYLSFIGEENNKISKSMWTYTKSVAHSKNPRKIEGNRNKLIKSVARAMSKIKRAKPFEGEQGYQKTVLEYLDLYSSLLKNDYAKIVDLKEVAEQSYDFMEAYILAQELADKRMQEAQQNYAEAQKAYAARNNIKLIDAPSELSKKMKISNKVFEHKNDVYLLFFKSNIQERFLMQAISNKDISAIQQNANALQTFAKEGLAALDTVTLYKEDDSLIKATKDALEFYLEESEKEIPEMLEFYAFNEKFEAIRKAIDKKPANKRAKKEIDTFNEMVGEMNDAIKDFNKTNEKLNNERSKMINEWNTASGNFLSRHVPKE